MSNLHRRLPPASNMGEDIISQAPLLGRESSSDDGNHARRDSYGSTSSKNDVVVTVNATEEGDGANIQDGIKQADAINQVWSRAALILAYSL